MQDNTRACVLISTYDLGHQPVGVATTARSLLAAGFRVTVCDLAVDELDAEAVSSADVIGVHVPMHTATRMAVATMPRLRTLNPGALIIAFGLYAALNADALIDVGVDAAISGEYESAVVDLAQARSLGTQPFGHETYVTLRRQADVLPWRAGFSALDRYVRLRLDGQTERMVGRTDTTRGCRHLCRHCPVPAVYGGRFFAVDHRIVMQDIEQLVAAGAEHITFGDPDFFNGPQHGLRVARDLHRCHPAVTWDCTIKVEHLVHYRKFLPELSSLGCVLVTTAVESFEPEVLELLGKGHSVEDFETVLELTREIGIGLNPTFVAFSPLTTPATYRDFLAHLRRLDLHAQITPIQFTIRLLVTARSGLLESPVIAERIGPFDAQALVYPWAHVDPRVDLLHRRILELVEHGGTGTGSALFREVWREASFASEVDYVSLALGDDQVDDRKPIPYLTEPWYC